MPLFKKKEKIDIPAETTEEIPEAAPAEKLSLFDRMKQGLAKTREGLMAGVDRLARQFGIIDEALFEELEETLILADLGVETAMDITEALRARVKAEKPADAGEIKTMLAEALEEILTRSAAEKPFSLKTPAVILVIGVNGAGKTTTIGKLTKCLKDEGKTVLIAAADTFRAAAIDQLEVWCQRADVPMIRQAEGSDPAAVVFDALQAAKARKTDILIVDTAGRLHNKKNLMEELRKIFRIISTQFAEAHREVFLVLDATTGQNAVQQAKLFKETADITGIVLTKLDGTAKGGVVVSLANELDIPVRYIGIGEGIGDLQPFDAVLFAKALVE